ncbi:MAG: polysaccharide deacetylase family protein [Polaromonas sp.]|uniref:polysaccharide deacetylase family protein n=1 Tax=Polaromonas sp. TaxID=1869339 RepID=UPI002488D651|nr:polysaccharide deacetylase family protein [Polaromonas sp.]MDI1270368.1 polysaccharide deacetylase family protein [Polaromonas sp.]
MSLHHHILAAAYYPVRVLKAVGRSVGLVPGNQLRVLLYHDIAPADQANFASQLRWLQRSWNFVSVEQFESMVSGKEPIHGRNLLLTFDDGFTSNRVVAEEVLNPMGIQALFFAVSGLVGITDRLEARRLIAERIYPGTRAEELPAHWGNMGWGDLEALLEQGHAIGCHTGTHARLSGVDSPDGLEREITSSADTLEQRLGVSIDHFSYTFGNLASFSEEALAVARRRFRFIYSGLRGDNAQGGSPFALRRDSAEFQDEFSNYTVFPNKLLGAFLEGAADAHYAPSRARLDAWNLRE